MFQTVDQSREYQRAAIARDLAQHFAELSKPDPIEKFSITKMIRDMSEQNFRSGESYEANVVQAAAISQGGAFDPQRAVVPWGAMMSRDLHVATASAGGRLVAANTVSALDALRPYSLAARLGVTFIENQNQDVLIPNVTTATTGNWLADETSAIVSTDPVIGVVSSKPKTFGAMLKASFQLMRQTGAGGEAFIRKQLLEAVGNALDAAFFAGTGADGQPTGLSLAAGVESIAIPGADFERINACAMESVVSAAVGDDTRLAWVTTPGRRGLLKQWPIYAAASNWYLWEKGRMNDIPGYVSTNCPIDTIFLGDWQQALITLWGSGLQIEVDPYSSFKTGAISVRVLMSADVQFPKPAAFARWFDTPL